MQVNKQMKLIFALLNVCLILPIQTEGNTINCHSVFHFNYITWDATHFL